MSEQNYAVATLKSAFKIAKDGLASAQTRRAQAQHELNLQANYVEVLEKKVTDLGMALEALGAPRE